ncbi:MAG: ABC transporter ATP-binding protein [Alphaproteobacteria bacterium]|nr:ABC transporter ATP-binding protein [Alphaproteobacteria bacterium]
MQDSISPFPLRVERADKSYNGKRVLKEVSLTLSEGEMFGLIGLNGAGKTTLIKIVLDLITADSGAAFLYERPVTDMAARRHLSYLPEKFQPSRYFKGYEYLELCLSYYRRRLDRASARAWAEKLDLDPQALSARVGTYSKGMGQKLGLVGAFLVDAPLLLLDEPMSGLDPRARIRLKEVMLEQKRHGKTVFFSSHILSDIDEVCDRIGILHEGKLYYLGTPAAFKERYGNVSLERSFLELIAGPAAYSHAA